MTYTKEEKALIDRSREFYMEHSPKSYNEKTKASVTEVIHFGHDLMGFDPKDHGLMWSILKKRHPDVESHAEISEKKAKDEEAALIDHQENVEEEKIKALEEENRIRQEEIKKRQEELEAKRQARLKELEQEKERLLAKQKEMNP